MAELFIGLMSGTSVNGIDAVLGRFEQRPELVASSAYAIPETVRTECLALGRAGANELDRAARLDNTIARLFSSAVAGLLQQEGLAAADIAAIGSHGQTVRHSPPEANPDDPDRAYTVQLGNPSLLAELTGITTIADFRRRDMAAGGHGAPLAPAFHSAFVTLTNAATVVVNIGGIANITLLPGTTEGAVVGFDTGPGNALLDEWADRHLGQPFDQSGQWAASGTSQDSLLQRWLAEPYFAQPAPKSTGRELFNLRWLGSTEGYRCEDIQATLLTLTVRTISDAILRLPHTPEQVWICGGGVHNKTLMAALAENLAPRPVESFSRVGIDPDFVEALGFAWLARQTLMGLPGNLPAVTGARGPRVLGGIYPA